MEKKFELESGIWMDGWIKEEILFTYAKKTTVRAAGRKQQSEQFINTQKPE